MRVWAEATQRRSIVAALKQAGRTAEDVTRKQGVQIEWTTY